MCTENNTPLVTLFFIQISFYLWKKDSRADWLLVVAVGVLCSATN